jgi:hypothetical protein
MNRKLLALVGGVIVVAAALGGVAVVFGLVPGPGGGGSTGRPPTVAEPTAENGTEPEPAGFEYAVTNVSECGRTCRLLESELTNTMTESASNVTLTYDVYAGGNSTVWEGRESLGSLAANATTEQETRIEVGMSGGLKIRQNGGNATIITTVYAGGEERAQFSNTQNVD